MVFVPDEDSRSTWLSGTADCCIPLGGMTGSSWDIRNQVGTNSVVEDILVQHVFISSVAALHLSPTSRSRSVLLSFYWEPLLIRMPHGCHTPGIEPVTDSTSSTIRLPRPFIRLPGLPLADRRHQHAPQSPVHMPLSRSLYAI